MDEKRYKIEDVSKRTGLTKRAIRYYEDVNLIKPLRSESTYRLYSEEDINTIIKIKELRNSLGFSLSEIKDIFDLEFDLKKILRGEVLDAEYISKSIEMVKHEIKLIEEKESTLEKAKAKYIEVLSILDKKN